MGPLDGPRRPPAAGGAPTSLVIFAHGYGSNGDDLIGLAPALARALPHTAFVSPDAPEAVPGYPAGRQWFALTRLDPLLLAQGARGASGVLDRFIDAELARHALPASACALVGFSQGAMMSLHVGLRRAEPLAAVVGFSGALVAPERLPAEVASRPPVLLAHGDADQVVPVHALAAARDALAGAGVGCLWRVSPGLPHSIGQDGLAAAAGFLRDAFAGRLAGWRGPDALPSRA
ncbi:MAG: prolyl oligopeptidase family serine peptidase [Caulobacteraceae bacterium]|nr:prolyl oligopeptidase family serine peptidase [Caulobacter sp.]